MNNKVSIITHNGVKWVTETLSPDEANAKIEVFKKLNIEYTAYRLVPQNALYCEEN